MEGQQAARYFTRVVGGLGARLEHRAGSVASEVSVAELAAFT